ncbi:Glutathione S-transferase L2, chloroplastic-like protein [Drosera capensis]
MGMWKRVCHQHSVLHQTHLISLMGQQDTVSNARVSVWGEDWLEDEVGLIDVNMSMDTDMETCLSRLYISYTCPYVQRVWITRNCKGLQDKIKLVPIDLQDRPAWYKEKVYPANKSSEHNKCILDSVTGTLLEHNNEVRGESLDLIKYIDSHFEGPSLFPDGINEETGAALDCIETALSKFTDGPFFLGQFSLVDVAYAPFIERFKPFLLEVRKYDITTGRPKLAAWILEMNQIEGFKHTQRDPKELVESYKKRFLPGVPRPSELRIEPDAEI